MKVWKGGYKEKNVRRVDKVDDDGRNRGSKELQECGRGQKSRVGTIGRVAEVVGPWWATGGMVAILG